MMYLQDPANLKNNSLNSCFFLNGWGEWWELLHKMLCDLIDPDSQKPMAMLMLPAERRLANTMAKSAMARTLGHRTLYRSRIQHHHPWP